MLNALKDVLEYVLYFFDGDDDDGAPTYNDDRRRPTTDQGFGIDGMAFRVEMVYWICFMLLHATNDNVCMPIYIFLF